MAYLGFLLKNSTPVIENDSFFLDTLNRQLTDKLLHQYADKFCIRIYHYSINLNHIHLLLFSTSKFTFQNFIRVFSGQVSQRLLNCYKGKGLDKPFWEEIAWTRIVGWGRDFRTAFNYIEQNCLEFRGLKEYQPRT